MDHAVEIRLGEGLIRGSCAAPPMWKVAHGELRAGLADRLRAMTSIGCHVDGHARAPDHAHNERADPSWPRRSEPSGSSLAEFPRVRSLDMPIPAIDHAPWARSTEPSCARSSSAAKRAENARRQRRHDLARVDDRRALRMPSSSRNHRTKMRIIRHVDETARREEPELAVLSAVSARLCGRRGSS